MDNIEERLEKLERMAGHRKADEDWMAELRMTKLLATPPPKTRRISIDEYLALLGNSKLEFLEGRLLTKSGIELFVGSEQFSDRLRADILRRLTELESRSKPE
jgi:hypothetical protein